MATQSRRQNTSVVDLLDRQGQRFEFFQAVRLLQRWANQQDDRSRYRSPRVVGRDTPPHDEPIRFGTNLSSSFPAAAIASIKMKGVGPAPTADQSDRPSAKVKVNFLGLTGPQGVLPTHFNRLLIEQHRANDDRLAKFQDLFNHRLISLFYRAWEKYRFDIRYERSREQSGGGEGDPFTDGLLSLVGMGSAGLGGRLAIDDQALIYYGGHFSAGTRNADGLADLAADYVGVPVRIEQFQGQWLDVSQEDRSRLNSTSVSPEPRNQLGINTTLGTRIWHVESRFRVVLGPLSYQRFMRLIPEGSDFAPLRDLVRCYVGPQFDFDIQPILRADQVPACRLGQSTDMPRLGRNAFVRTQPFNTHFDQAAFTSGNN